MGGYQEKGDNEWTVAVFWGWWGEVWREEQWRGVGSDPSPQRWKLKQADAATPRLCSLPPESTRAFMKLEEQDREGVLSYWPVS